MATDMNMFVMIDICRSSCVDRCEHESRELSLRTPVCYITYRHIYVYIYIYIYAHPPPHDRPPWGRGRVVSVPKHDLSTDW